MDLNSKNLASEVVKSFQALLDDDVREAVGEHHFYALHGMVREAITEQSEAIFEQAEQSMKQLKAEMVERRPLEL